MKNVDLCTKCVGLKFKPDLNIFEDYCNGCKKMIRKSDPNFYQKEYSRIYRIANKEYFKTYRDNYSKDNLKLKKSKLDIHGSNDKSRSRIYMCKVGEDKVKIGATSIDSKRIYLLEDKLNLIGVLFEPLFYYDCRNPELITMIEKYLRNNFCKPEIGMDVHSFKKELAPFSKLNEMCKSVEFLLEKSRLSYSIISFR